MGSAFTSLLAEIGSGHTPWKLSVRACSTVDVPTLSGLLVVGGVTLQEGDRVLLIGQDDPRLNGVWVASANAWTRAVDMASGVYLQLGTTIRVMEGTDAGLYTLTAPTSGTITVGATALSFGFDGSGAVVTASLTTPIVIDGSKSVDGSGYGTLTVSLATSDHRLGGTYTIIINPYTRSGVSLAPALNATGDDFDPALGYEIEITWLGSYARTYTRQLERIDTSAPRILWTHVVYGSARRVLVKFDRPCYIRNRSAITLSSSDVDEVISGDGTDEILLLTSAANDPASLETIEFGVGAVQSMCGVPLATQTWHLRWRVDPSALPGVTGYRDASGTISSPHWLYSTDAPTYQDGQNWDVGANAPTWTDPIYDGEPGLVFKKSEGDTLNSQYTGSQLCGETDSTVWYMTLPGTILNNAYKLNNDALVSMGTTWYIGQRHNGTDDDYALMGSYPSATADPYGDTVEVPIVSRQPSLIRRRHVASTTMEGKVNCRTPVSGTCLASATLAFVNLVLGGMGSADRCTDQTCFAILTCSTGHTDAALLDGVEAFFSSLPFGRFLLPVPNVPTQYMAAVGTALEIPWTQVLLHPTAPASADLSWFTFSVTGLPGSPSVTSRRLLWTPAGGDVGAHTATVTIRYASRVVAVFDIRIEVVSASTTGAISVCVLGDSWTDGNTLSVQVYTTLTAMGYTVTMLGARGGISVSSVDAATDKLTTNGAHGYADNEVIEFYDSAGLIPAGLGAAYATRYVFADTSTTLKVRSASLGSAIDITSDGWSTATVSTTTGIFTKVGHGMSGQPKAYGRKPILRFRPNGGVIPTGLSAGTDYYVTVLTNDTFTVSTTYLGPAIVPSTAGSGSWQFGPAYLFVRSPKQRHEGRGGWSNAHYKEPAGNPVAGPGPFIDPATELFSWSYFKSNNLGGVSPGFFVSQLGINGGLNFGVTANDRTAMIHHTRSVVAVEANYILRECLRNEASAKAIMMIPAAPNCRESAFYSAYGATYSQWIWRQGLDHIQTAYKLAFSNRESERLFTGTFQVLDCETDFAAIDPVHPSDHTKTGQQIAYAIRRAKDWV